MTPREEKFLRSMVADLESTRRTAGNPLDDSYQANLLRGAANGLTLVAGLCLDWKLVAIVKLLQSWLADREAEQAQGEMTRGESPQSVDAWDGHTYY